MKEKITYVGHFTNNKLVKKSESSDLEKLIKGNEFGYWMRTGNKSTNDGTGQRYEEIFHQHEMKKEKRIISHAKNDSNIDSVLGKDGRKYSISEAFDKKIDWIQIDIGYLIRTRKGSDSRFMQICSSQRFSYSNGWKIMGGKSKPIIGIPIYDEHTNNNQMGRREKT